VQTRRWFCCFALALLLAACATAPRRDDAPYRALGERAGIARTVDAILLRVLADPRIGELFTATDPAQLAPLLTDQICAAAGGPCLYAGRSMEESHAGLNISEAQFAAFVEDTIAGMEAERVPPAAQAALLATLGGMKAQIVGR
jgi:hemoglobin